MSNTPSKAWPTKGMTLFTEGSDDDWRANALLQAQPDWLGYRVAYEEAARILLQRTRSGEGQDTLIAPILFLARHAIEVGLKELHQLAARYKGVKAATPKHHKLVPVWDDVRQVLCQIDSAQPDEAMSAFGKLVKEMDQTDPTSMTFRYPVDTKGAPIFTFPSATVPHTINTSDLDRSVRAMFGFVEGWSAHLSSAIDEMS